MESQLTASSRLGSKFLSSLESQKEEGKAGEHEDDMDNNYDNIDDDVNANINNFAEYTKLMRRKE